MQAARSFDESIESIESIETKQEDSSVLFNTEKRNEEILDVEEDQMNNAFGAGASS